MKKDLPLLQICVIICVQSLRAGRESYAVMHEMSVMLGMVNLAENYAREHHGEKIVKIVLDIGEMNSAVPEYVEYLFPDVTEGTMLEGAELCIHRIPVTVRCSGCGRIYPWRQEGYRCPDCGQEDCRIQDGRSFEIREIMIE